MRSRKNPYIMHWLWSNKTEIVKLLTLWKARKYLSKELATTLGIICGRSWLMFQCCLESLFYMFMAVKAEEFKDLFKGEYKGCLDDQ